ncbi:MULTISPECIES: hypothetical protein [unclassified Chitinophaga]|uniref:hypothetical protein n=1 Tax=unclassified Chitinophaga TaxID=2619133 RepID=UPI0009CDC54D|nr:MULTISPECIES: hypothetical protein [unclassified Chitinophaga]OMP74579.1 hypothetical protein BW716_34635 [[Flexibacter] sp. ATCC 35208]WPV66720.1 hypothetical protein QQL36_33535 [Chitinophaga sp. LS1]
MNKKEVVKAIMTKMEPEMSRFGFKKSFGRHWFIKQQDKYFKGYYRLIAYDGLNPGTRDVGIRIEPHVCLQNIEIEKVCEEISSRGLELNSLYTIGNSIAEIIANPTGEYLSRNNELKIFFDELNPDATANALLKYFEGVALPYIERFANWQSLDEIFNTNLDKSSVHCWLYPERHIRGIIIAKMLGKSNTSELIRLHTKGMERVTNEQYIVEFERLLKIVDRIPVII